MKFFNRRYFTRQDFEIQKSSLKIERRNMFDAIEYEIPFEFIHNKIKIQTIINNNLIIVGAFFILFSLLFQIGPNDELTIIFFSIGLLFIIVSFINRKKVVTMTTLDGNKIELYFTNQNKEEVVEYANAIIKASDNFLLHKFSKIDRLLPIEPQIDNIQFLLNREIISEEKFETLKNQILGKENQTSIGFGQN
jgi:ABC-type multidrug transport system fused ATPase/permease subunit